MIAMDNAIDDPVDQALFLQFIIMDNSGLTTTEFRAAMSHNAI